MIELKLHEKTWPKSKILIEGSSEYAAKASLDSFGHLSLALKTLFDPAARSTCFDIGANIGLTSLLMDQHFNDAEIRAFEPHPKTFAQLSANIDRNSLGSNRLRTFDFGLGKAEGELLFRDVDKYNTGNSIILEKSLAATQNTIRVPVRRIDDLDDLPERIDLMKIDVEGFELDVLEGGADALKRTRVALIEFNHWCISSLAAVLPQNALATLFELFEAIYVFDLKQKNFRRLKSDAEKWSFLHQNMVMFNVNDLLCTNDAAIIDKMSVAED
jgi:FkbM family methyltransferase